MFKKILQSLILKLNREQQKAIYFFIQRSIPVLEQPVLNRFNTLTILDSLLKKGFQPANIIDIGAFEGTWSRDTSMLFPKASYHLFEPQVAKKSLILENMKGLSYKLYSNLLGREQKENVPFYVMESGSSVKEELSSHDRKRILLPMTTLDLAIGENNIGENTLLKLDVQGLELEVLEGAKNTMAKCEVVVMEVSFLDYNKDSPLADEIIGYMQQNGYVIFDFGAFLRNGNDRSLIQADIVFIKKTSLLRQHFNNFLKPFTVFAC